MGITLSHFSALDATRTLRSEGRNLKSMDTVPLTSPSPDKRKRWTMREFDPSTWRWDAPSPRQPLHVLVPRGCTMSMQGVSVHRNSRELPPNSIIWLDEHSSMVCPELLFLQMTEVLSFPMLVLLGYELCGRFSRCAEEPLNGPVSIDVPNATNTDAIATYLNHFSRSHGVAIAREALRHVSDHAISAPEAVLATIYSIPSEESGYGMGPVKLNQRIDDNTGYGSPESARFPDLLFDFAPVGINYDGERDHLDLSGLIQAASKVYQTEGEKQELARLELKTKMAQVRSKTVDDHMRDRQLAARGYVVLPATKENIQDGSELDAFTRHILQIAHNVFGVDTQQLERTLEDSGKARDRSDLVRTMTPNGMPWGDSRGKM